MGFNEYGYLDAGMKLPVLAGLGTILLAICWFALYFALCL